MKKKIKQICAANKKVPGFMIKRLRQQKQWTQEFLAEKVGTTAATISRLERGLQGYDSTTIQSLIAVFEIPACLLFASSEKQEKAIRTILDLIEIFES